MDHYYSSNPTSKSEERILEYKIKYPDTSMDELAKIVSMETDKTITKSGINHHFRKIKELVTKHKNK